jgi:hypothetical protein
MKLLLLITVIAISVLSFGCGGSGNPANKANTSADNANVPRANLANVNANTSASPAETGFDLPSPKPVENGKTQTFKGITFTIPADWKKLRQNELGTTFESPEKIRFSVYRNYDMQEGDMMADFIKLRKENPTYKAKMLQIDGTLGILALNEKSTLGGDVLSWTTFPPPDAKGYAMKRAVQLICPAGMFEQYKQQMTDILYSVKLER